MGMPSILADTAIEPLMRLGTYRGESPQQTHFWNNMKLPISSAKHLDVDNMVFVPRFPDAMPRQWWNPRWHLPRFGGWKNYVVLEADFDDGTWYVGWKTGTSAGVSLIPIHGLVRVLIGPENVWFFGVEAARHRQIKLRQAADGIIGDNGPHREVPLH